jgi:hypothetical protein
MPRPVGRAGQNSQLPSTLQVGTSPKAQARCCSSHQCQRRTRLRSERRRGDTPGRETGGPAWQRQTWSTPVLHCQLQTHPGRQLSLQTSARVHGLLLHVRGKHCMNRVQKLLTCPCAARYPGSESRRKVQYGSGLPSLPSSSPVASSRSEHVPPLPLLLAWCEWQIVARDRRPACRDVPGHEGAPCRVAVRRPASRTRRRVGREESDATVRDLEGSVIGGQLAEGKLREADARGRRDGGAVSIKVAVAGTLCVAAAGA